MIAEDEPSGITLDEFLGLVEAFAHLSKGTFSGVGRLILAPTQAGSISERGRIP